MRKPDPTRRLILRRLMHVLVTAACLSGIGLWFPHLLGTSWAGIGATATAISPAFVVVLIVVWALGLVAHTITLSAALPGLSHRRALLLSLTGSAIANVLPVGGAAGIAMNSAMTRRWGFSTTSFASYAVITNLWNVLGKILLPLVLVPLSLWLGASVGQGATLLIASAVAVPLVGGLLGWLIFGRTTLVRVRRRLGTGVTRFHTAARRLLDAGESVRERTADVARTRWRRLSLGLALYVALLLTLLTLCLHVAGAGVPLGFIVLAFCGERLLTLASITPGGLGVVELGLAGVLLLAPGASAAGIAAGILLYRLLTFGLEIPVGGALLAGWVWTHRGTDHGLKGQLA